MKVLLCLAFFVACTYAVNTIADIAIGTAPVSITLAGPYDTEIKLFKLWVPHNTSSVSFTLTNTDSDTCSYLYMYVRVGQSPCAENEDDSYNICEGGSWDDGANIGSSQKVYTFDPVTSYSGFRWEVDTYWFIGFRKYSSSYTTCAMTINSITATDCGAQVATQDDSDDLSCSTENALTWGATTTITAEAGYNKLYSAALTGTNYGRIDVVVNSTYSNLYFYAKSGAAPAYYYDCSYSSSSSVGDFYISQFSCITPIGAAKWYFLILYGGSGTYDATFTATPLQCPTGKGGFNCTAELVAFNPLNPAATAGPFTIPADAPEYNSEAFYYFYFDFNLTASTPAPFVFTISAINAGASGYSYIKYNGFPESSSPYGYTFGSQYTSLSTSSATHWNMYAGDLSNSARIYWGISKSGSAALTFGLNSTASTTGVPTTSNPTTANPNPTTANPTTANPTTSNPTTANPTTKASTTAADTGSASDSTDGVATLAVSFACIFAAVSALFMI